MCASSHGRTDSSSATQTRRCCGAKGTVRRGRIWVDKRHPGRLVGTAEIPVICLVARESGDPHVALHINGDAVRRDHDALAEARKHRTGLAIELEDGVEGRDVAVDGATAGSRCAAARCCPRWDRRQCRPWCPTCGPPAADPNSESRPEPEWLRTGRSRRVSRHLGEQQHV